MLEKSPAFRFYARDFQSDDRVLVMSEAGRGIYIILLCVEWLAGSLPADDRSLARLALASDDVWAANRTDVLSCFTLGKDGRYTQKRLEQERAKQRKFNKGQSDKGKRSVEVRLNRKSTTVEPRLNHGSIPVGVGLEPNSTFASSFAFASPLASSSSSSLPLASSSEQEPSSAVAVVGVVESGFEVFWHDYPKKVGKGDAAKVWKTMRPTSTLQATILAAVSEQRQCRQWLKDGGQFIPNPATWLRQKRWGDAPDPDVPLWDDKTAHNLAVAKAFIERGEHR